ncbi:MAG: hypothetical protein F6K22_27495 [Okeania sp. SIO2F4]|uniref:hypothetical protein n=1 Tax=Okeania sp. SIO2F4 TaxID=2607790 RepID=UPI001429493A|nr:hypothetical protein [Okeania sp. SIO2F4]NES06226.1 hypothetical protein [Okeania sp. SIO2F4]
MQRMMNKEDIDYLVDALVSKLNDGDFRMEVELSDAFLAQAIGKHMTEAMHNTIIRPCHIMNEIYKSLVVSIWQKESDLTQE